jgi:MinD-like ATPase involved in chromosome partitioning or flagellar assembly
MRNIVVALGNTDWESQFVSALSHPMNGLRIQRRCVDGVDVRAAVQVVEVDAVLLSDHTTRVDEDLFLELDSRGVSVIALTKDPARWEQQGIVNIIRIDERNPLAAVPLVNSVMRDGKVEIALPQEPSGRLIAVAGFGGAAGRSSCTRELGWQLALSGQTTLMVDADTYNPSLHQEMLREASHAGLLDLCRAQESRKLSAESIRSYTDELTENLALVSGLPRSSRWSDLRGTALVGVWGTARSSFDNVVVDLGPVIENDQALMHEIHLPRRHSAALTALDVAQTTILCTRGDSIGISRLVKGFHEFYEVFAHTQVHVVVWGRTNSSAEVSQAISRHTGLGSIIHIDRNDVLMNDALLKGQPVSALKPKSEFARSFAHLVEQINSTHDDVAQKRLARVLHIGRDRAAA